MFRYFLNFFKADNFKGDLYGRITNQISHTSFSLFLVYLFNLFFETQTSILIISIFWLAWEARHLWQTYDFEDFVEDLFFEISGLVIYLLPWWSFIVFGVLVFLIFKNRR